MGEKKCTKNELEEDGDTNDKEERHFLGSLRTGSEKVCKVD
jgi:hypothetical protein